LNDGRLGCLFMDGGMPTSGSGPPAPAAPSNIEGFCSTMLPIMLPGSGAAALMLLLDLVKLGCWRLFTGPGNPIPNPLDIPALIGGRIPVVPGVIPMPMPIFIPGIPFCIEVGADMPGAGVPPIVYILR
jgi:hypothetical protein